jgi:long-chain acyl-CoA synthetase
MSFLTEVSGPPATDTPPPQWVFEQIAAWARRAPDRPALVLDHQDRSEEYKYSEVLDRASAVMSELAARGIQRGDRIGILMENTPQWVFVLLGAMQAGAISVPLATTLPEQSLELIAQHAGCKLIFADETNREKASSVGRKIQSDVLTPSARAQSGDRSARPPEVRFDGSSTAILIYTSGTTGNPKGVELTFDNLNHEIRGAVEALHLTPDHRILSVLPFSHVLPLIANGLGPLCIGATVVFLSSISPQRIIDAFHRHRITFFICVPQFFYIVHRRIFSQVAAQPWPARRLFALMKRLASRVNNPAVRRRLFGRVHQAIGPDLQLLASGGSRFDPEIAQDLNDLGYTILQAYGLTETSAAATATPLDANRIGTVGKPLRGVTIHIDSPNQRGIGEVLIRGPILMKGYYKSPDETSQAIKDGWFRTGDLGFIDADGYLSVTGRCKDVIVLANGENVYPEELETHYSRSPFVKDICIMGISQNGASAGSEVLHAIVVPDMDEFRRQGQTAIQEMIKFEIENLSKQVPSYFRIHSLAVRNDPLPRTVTRKLKRFEIEQEEQMRRQMKEQRPGAVAPPAEDHLRLRTGAGLVIANLIRESKPDVGTLEPAMNIELDLGFDSLARVELLGIAEARLGVHIDEPQAARIFTLGELVDAFDAASASERPIRQSWKEILQTADMDAPEAHHAFRRRPILNPLWLVTMRLTRFVIGILFGLKYDGVEKLPANLPFLLCPNHQSFLDGPLLISTLPRREIYNIFILGYSDYWKGFFSRLLAEICNIVPIDPNVNLVRAMQVGAAGLRRGKMLLIFPEGTRTIDGHVAEFKKGAAILAFELGIPIVPVGIRGAFESWPRGGTFRFHPIEVHFGDPINPKAFEGSADPYAALTDQLQKDVKALCGDNL